MPRLSYHTAGESHGPAIAALIEGFPAGVPFDVTAINRELRRRQGGFGRSARQRIEHDEASVISGVRLGRTTGGPVLIHVINRDARLEVLSPMHCPRPGHADLAGSLKWLTVDCRDVIERASARETVGRVAAGALARSLLDEFSIEVIGYVTQIGSVDSKLDDGEETELPDDPIQIRSLRDSSEVYCLCPERTAEMVDEIQRAGADGDTLGGVVETRVYGAPPGLGSCMRCFDKLDGRIFGAVGSIQAIKGVEIGLGFQASGRRGSTVHDPIDFDARKRESPSLGYVRRTNHAGGIEGGMTNGSMILVRAAMKPISTLLKGMDSVDLRTREPRRSDYERSDVCAVPAVSVVVENVVAFEVARAFLEKFGGDTLEEVRAAYQYFLNAARRLH